MGPWDLAVVGAGPAGSFSALCAARAGLRVVLVDREVQGRDKACGEGLMPRGVQVLERAGLSELLGGAPRYDGIALCAGSRRAVGRFRRGAGRGVRRRSFDEALVAAAAAAGAEVRFTTPVHAVVEEPSCCRVLMRRGSAPSLAARFVLIADGGRSALSRAFSGTARRHAGRLGLVAHGGSSGSGELVEAHFGDGYQLVLTPVRGGRSIAALVGPGRARELSGSRYAAARWLAARGRELGLDLGEPDPPRVLPLLGPVPRVAGRRIALIGDAAGAVDPIVGCGISLALESAEEAVACIVGALTTTPAAAPLAAYARARARALRLPRLLAALSLVSGGGPGRARVAAGLLARAPALVDVLVSAVGERPAGDRGFVAG